MPLSVKDKEKIRKAVEEMESIKKIGRVRTKNSILPAIMGVLDPKIITPKNVMVFGRKGSGYKGKTTGRAFRCRMEGCPGYRIAVRWEHRPTLTFPCSKGMRLTKKGWRII